MNRETRIRFFLIFVLGMVLFSTSACEKKKAPRPEEPAVHRDAPPPVASTQTILHKTFAVSTSVKFTFEIPPHVALPHVHGTYKSFVQELGVQGNDDGANVDFFILNEDQYADFAGGHAGEALFSADAAHNQDVDFSLPASQDQPRKYYLVFRSSPGGAAKKLVQADFTLDF
jgi:hypothetical protein